MGIVWKFIEEIMHFFICKVFRLNVKEEKWEKWCQFVKFGLVGVSNTLISYIVYVILVAFSIHYLMASLIGFFVSVINAYYWNDKYVFKTDSEEKQVWWKVFLKTFASYSGTGLILNNILLFLWVNVLGVHEMIGPILNLFISIPLNFILNKYWAFKNNG